MSVTVASGSRPTWRGLLAPPGRAVPSSCSRWAWKGGPSWVPCGTWRRPLQLGRGTGRHGALELALVVGPQEVRAATGSRPRLPAATTALPRPLPPLCLPGLLDLRSWPSGSWMRRGVGSRGHARVRALVIHQGALPGRSLEQPPRWTEAPTGAFSSARLQTVACPSALRGPVLHTPAPGPRGDRLQISLGAGPRWADTPAPQTSHLCWKLG